MSLLQPTPTPEFNARTYGDTLNDYIPACIGAIKQCNDDKASTRQYIEEKMKQK